MLVIWQKSNFPRNNTFLFVLLLIVAESYKIMFDMKAKVCHKILPCRKKKKIAPKEINQHLLNVYCPKILTEHSKVI